MACCGMPDVPRTRTPRLLEVLLLPALLPAAVASAAAVALAAPFSREARGQAAALVRSVADGVRRAGRVRTSPEVRSRVVGRLYPVSPRLARLALQVLRAEEAPAPECPLRTGEGARPGPRFVAG